MKEIKDMSFEEALLELESIVGKIDSGEETLDRAVESFERGTLLRLHCENKLKEARMKIEKIVKNQEGRIEIKDLEV